MRSRIVRAVAGIALALGFAGGFVPVALAVEPTGLSAGQRSPDASVVEPVPEESTVCSVDELPLPGLPARRVPDPEPVKVLCAGKVIDYTLEYDSKNKKVIVTMKGGANFKGCELKIKEPVAGWKPTATGFEVPFDKEDVKVKIEGAFVCKKADGGELVVPIDQLEFTFRPPNTFVLPLK